MSNFILSNIPAAINNKHIKSSGVAMIIKSNKDSAFAAIITSNIVL
ncbi:hypothetical protein ATCC51562_1679 [Campylobacter concisus ATCC 51562]|uniref:Uncharacterized protein n=1 Tax=Campylobacter concisus ATCC 51562 TaxID=1242969 RepID=U2GCZ8_9BACT|nr:hypothetical protein ATCC51562_1679 [Campylobacter concisus ATCC 51562]